MTLAGSEFALHIKVNLSVARDVFDFTLGVL
jgi:hypothetical protein